MLWGHQTASAYSALALNILSFLFLNILSMYLKTKLTVSGIQCTDILPWRYGDTHTRVKPHYLSFIYSWYTKAFPHACVYTPVCVQH